MLLTKVPQQVQELIPKTYLNPSLYLRILQIYIDQNAGKHASLFHGRIITVGLGKNLHLNNKLIIFFTKTSDTVNARKVFDQMLERDVVSWTAMISGYSQQGYFGDALSLYAKMRREGVRANQFTFVSALKACVALGCLKGGLQIQGCVEKGRFVQNLVVNSALLNLHARCGKMADARFLFDTMEERDVVSWNTIIGGYAVQGFTYDSFELFRFMLMEGKIPDCCTFGSILRASIEVNDLSKVSQLHGLIIKLAFGSSNALTGSLIDAYAKCGSVGSAYQLYKGMVEKDIISCTALIMGLACQGNYFEDVCDLFKEIVMVKMGVDDVVLCSMLNLCAGVASVSMGRQIHAFALKCQPGYDVAMGNSLIDMYAKSGEIIDAARAFDEMEEKNVISWTSLIAGYGRHGYSEKAIELYKMMEHQGLKPNDVTFLSLLCACSHTGLTEQGWKIFDTMVSKYNIEPREEHFSCVVDLFARGGQLEAAYDLIHEMGIKGPASSIWGALLGACKSYGNVSLGKVAASRLLSIEPEKPVNYVVLAGMYAASGAWDNALRTRKLMEERSSPKDPGYSLLSFTETKMVLLQPS